MSDEENGSSDSESVERGDNVLLIGDENTYLREVSRIRLQFAEGVIEPDDIIGKEYGETVETHIGEEFRIITPSLKDAFEHQLQRTAQIITPKDAGCILTETMVGKNSKVLEAGTGSAYLTIMLANVAGNVVSYEVKPEFLENAKENIEKVGFDNVTIRKRDVIEEGFDEGNADLVVLDMMHLERAVKHAKDALKPGGYIVCYCPVVEQVEDCVDEMEELDLTVEKIVENIQREWKTSPTRPKSQSVPHTAFLVFGRKIKS
ncbi:MAG: methyltransferase domain-containing protein [Halobacteria archaeon]|nr:methyltransferase domain-containing protein [Halobacteria archaeon]